MTGIIRFPANGAAQQLCATTGCCGYAAQSSRYCRDCASELEARLERARNQVWANDRDVRAKLTARARRESALYLVLLLMGSAYAFLAWLFWP